MLGQVDRTRMKETPLPPLSSQQQQQQKQISGGIRGSVRQYLFNQMLDAVPGSFKILICDSFAAGMLNNCMRVHELMEHGVTLLEDLMTPRQPIINSPAIYFFSPEDASVNQVIQDWVTKDPYKEVHIFVLSTTPERHLQLIAQSRVAPKVLNFKDMMLEFSAPETLLFHLNMLHEFSQLLSPVPQITREKVLEIAASRLLSVFHTLNNGVPIIRYQRKSNICQGFAKIFFEKLAKLCYDIPDFKNGGDNGHSSIVIILDRSFDTVAPLIHERTYQSLLEDLMPLENNMYEQTFKNRSGVDSTRQYILDEEDPFWCQYRHQFFAHCLEEIPAALKKLHQENPTLAQGMGHSNNNNNNMIELGSAVRALPEFQEKQAKLSLHIDICTKLMSFYREKRLAEICEIEQDIAAERKPFKTNLENVQRIVKDVSIPQSVRLRLVLLFAAASNTSEFSEAKKQQIIQEGGLMADANRFSNLEQVTTRIGRLQKENPNVESNKRGATNRNATNNNNNIDGDPFINQAQLIMEALANNSLDATDYPVMNSPYESTPANINGGVMQDPVTKKKTLRTGLALAAMRRDPLSGQGGLNGVGINNNNNNNNINIGISPRIGGKGGTFLDLGGNEGLIPITNNQRIVIFILGGVTYGEVRAAYEVSKKIGREIIIGGTSILRPDAFVNELSNLR